MGRSTYLTACAYVYFLILIGCSEKQENATISFMPIAEFPKIQEVVQEKSTQRPKAFLNTANDQEAFVIHSLDNTAFHIYNAAAFDNEKKGVIVGGTGLRIRSTVDGGKNWKENRLSPFADAFHSAAFSHGEVYVVGEASYIVKGDSTLSNWSVLDISSMSGILGDGQEFFKIKFNGDLGYVMGVDSKIGMIKPCILKTEDGGGSWNVVSFSGLENEDSGITDFDIISDSILYIVTSSGSAYQSNNGGVSWEPFFEPVEEHTSLNSIDFKSEDVGYIGGLNGLLYFTNNSGSSWAPVRFLDHQKDFNMSDIEYLTNDVWAVTTAKSFADSERPIFSYLLDGNGGERSKPLLAKKDSTIYSQGDSYHLYSLNDSTLFITDRNNLYKIRLNKLQWD